MSGFLGEFSLGDLKTPEGRDRLSRTLFGVPSTPPASSAAPDDPLAAALQALPPEDRAFLEQHPDAMATFRSHYAEAKAEFDRKNAVTRNRESHQQTHERRDRARQIAEKALK